jgi:hypothetical protein
MSTHAKTISSRRAMASPDVMLEAALGYAARGWHVFACEYGGKRPATTHGQLDATTDPDAIRRMWEGTPNANIGLALQPSGLVAADADTYKPDCDWVNFAASNDVPDTLTQRTGSGGNHYIFKADPGAGYAGAIPGVSGVDIKHNGYLIVVPSILVDPDTGEVGEYKWEYDVDPAPAPAWLPRKGAASASEGLQSARKDMAELIRQVLTGETYHDALRDLAAHHIACGFDERRVLALLQGVMKALSEKDGRWHERYDDLPRTVRSAVEKFGETPVEANPDRFLLHSVQDLLKIEPPEWLIEGWIPKKGVVILAGQPGAFKTFLAIALSYHVALGRPFDGRKVLQGPVVYAAYEGVSGFAIRAMGWEQFHDELPGDVPLSVLLDTFDLTNPNEVGEFIATLKARGAAPRLIIIDTFRKATPGADYNASEAMNLAITQAYRLTHEFSCAVLLIDHVGKDKSKGVMGSITKKGDVDGVLICSKASSNLVTVTADKLRDAEDGWTKSFQVETSEVEMPNGDKLETLVVLDVDPETTIPGAIHHWHAANEGGSKKILVSAVVENSTFSRGSVRRTLDRMIKNGVIDLEEHP